MKYLWQQNNKGYYDRDESLENKCKNENLSSITRSQIELYPVQTIMILNIANGMELKYVDMNKVKIVVGVDANEESLLYCEELFMHIQEQLYLIKENLRVAKQQLPHTDMVIANLMIENIGSQSFFMQLRLIDPKYVSCLVLDHEKEKKALRYPYGANYPPIDDDVEEVRENKLIHSMKELGYHCLRKEEYDQNQVFLLRMDFYKVRKEEIKLETKRFYLRKMTISDYDEIAEILQNEEVMYAYEHAFSKKEVFEWINKQILRYEIDGYGLWAMIDKRDGKLIGQCGITNQLVNNETVMEIGYLLNQNYWHQGFASEGARACKQYGFEVLKAKRMYSIIRENNVASMKVAIRNDMKQIGLINKQYYGLNIPHLIFCVEKNKNDRNDV